MRPVLCMITAPHVGADVEGIVARVGAAARAGVHLIQVRRPDLEAGTLARLVAGAVAAVEGTEARVLVNDRVDVALAAGAHGVHLRGDSMPVARVRAIAPPGFLVGKSVRSRDEGLAAIAAAAPDYLIFGTVFETGSKPGVPGAGVAGLAEVCAAMTIPVLGVGGMTPARLRGVAAAGAAGFAAIGLFADVDAGALPDVVHAAVAAFDGH